MYFLPPKIKKSKYKSIYNLCFHSTPSHMYTCLYVCNILFCFVIHSARWPCFHHKLKHSSGWLDKIFKWCIGTHLSIIVIIITGFLRHCIPISLGSLHSTNIYIQSVKHSNIDPVTDNAISNQKMGGGGGGAFLLSFFKTAKLSIKVDQQKLMH